MALDLAAAGSSSAEACGGACRVSSLHEQPAVDQSRDEDGYYRDHHHEELDEVFQQALPEVGRHAVLEEDVQCDEAHQQQDHRREDLPDDDEDGSGGEVLSSRDLVDNEWGEEDPEEYEDLEYFTDLRDKIRRAGRKLTPFHPTRGAAVIFSSGWENMHEVEPITSGVRYAVPCFFTTSPVPEVAYDQMVQGRPKTDEDIADDWLHLLLAHREGETPQEGVGRVKELLMKWHMLCAPLSEH